MDVRFSEEHELLRESVREFVARECPLARVREWVEVGQPFPAELWKQMAELGWLGLPLPEAFGGSGLGTLELAVVLEEMGRCLLPAPYYATVVLGAAAVALAGSEPQKRRILPAVAGGQLKASLALLEESARWDAAGIALEAAPERGGFRLSGTKRYVPDAQAADVLVVAARSGGAGAEGITLFLVETSDPGVSLRPIGYHDLTRRVCEVRLEGVHAGADAVLGEPDRGWPVLERLFDRARVALSAEMCGGAQQVLEMSVAFAKAREQFGRPIGSFQAIQHKCADMLLQLEGAKSATYYAAWAVDQQEPDAHTAACMAKAYCSDAYARMAGEGIQIHGGLGFTWEQDPHLYYKRAKASELDLGDGAWNREQIARALFDAD